MGGVQFDWRLALTIAGVIGLGLVWGWWTAPWFELRARARAVALIVGAAALQSVEIGWLLGPRSIVLLLIGWFTGLFVHSVFRAALRARSRERLTF